MKLWPLDQQKTFTGTFSQFPMFRGQFHVQFNLFLNIKPSFSEVVFPAEHAGTIGFPVALIVFP